MRQTHVAGERMFADYAGTTLDVIDGATGEVLRAQLFVAVLGASNYTYAEATWMQGLADWIGSHVRTIAFIAGIRSHGAGRQRQYQVGHHPSLLLEPAVNCHSPKVMICMVWYGREQPRRMGRKLDGA